MNNKQDRGFHNKSQAGLARTSYRFLFSDDARQRQRGLVRGSLHCHIRGDWSSDWAVVVVTGDSVVACVWPDSMIVSSSRHAAVATVGPTPSSALLPPHWLAARPRDPEHTAGIFPNSYWQLVRRRPVKFANFLHRISANEILGN